MKLHQCISRPILTTALLLASSGFVWAQTHSTKFRDCPVCPEMVTVPAGSFQMGSPKTEKGRDDAEGPLQKVEINKPFAIGMYEATRAEFAAFVRETSWKPSSAPNCGYRTNLQPTWKHDNPKLDWENPGFEQNDNHPVVCVSWNDAKAYASWLSKKTGKSYRLPTDAEWEYAARAGTATSRTWGENPADACKFANVGDLARDARLVPGVAPGTATHNCNDGFAYTAPVGSFRPNPIGLRDVIGNVWEWVEDCWNNTLEGIPADGSARKGGDCNSRTVRGGSWLGPPPGATRLAKRSYAPVGTPYINLGIRVALTLTKPAAEPPAKR